MFIEKKIPSTTRAIAEANSGHDCKGNNFTKWPV